jgi:hypothetical protein
MKGFFFAPLGWVYNHLIDEKIFWGRVAGCHSETVSTAQNPLAASYIKSEKMKRFLPRKLAKKTRRRTKEAKRDNRFGLCICMKVSPLLSPHVSVKVWCCEANRGPGERRELRARRL